MATVHLGSARRGLHRVWTPGANEPLLSRRPAWEVAVAVAASGREARPEPGVGLTLVGKDPAEPHGRGTATTPGQDG